MQTSPCPNLQGTGYLAPEYGASFAALGEIVTLPHSGLQLIRREIRPGVFDLAGTYPYSMCADFGALPRDLKTLAGSGAVALSFVSDPFAEDSIVQLQAGLQFARPFKTHCILDLGGDWRSARSKNTRYYVRKGYQAQTVEIHPGSADFTPLFWRLYLNTIRRHAVTGIPRLSAEILARQLAVPGAYLAVSRIGATVTGALLSYVHPSHVNAHLVCFDDAYYDRHTSYILIDAAAAEAERLGAHAFNIGGAAGGKDDPEDGLYQFKRRWTPEARLSRLCGHVLDPGTYDRLCNESATTGSSYFPAYRQPGSQFEWRLPDP
ncbi:GNAT family N-acetyltransferase [Ruegeria sp. PrR005]|uniref:GNAT family N-acetyltransferase n=1 Tax=Ruegeria sp. PrR005 TaxID=2706882 RepID=A0A6B2NR06_9RHOB|nr:GNAT family N-acetyltransferase [Ruegeria sp. PrR005]NDW44285.1 GNAT family N-acetyltransferase [Ruegeria sp. PrR005]